MQSPLLVRGSLKIRFPRLFGSAEGSPDSSELVLRDRQIKHGRSVWDHISAMPGPGLRHTHGVQPSTYHESSLPSSLILVPSCSPSLILLNHLLPVHCLAVSLSGNLAYAIMFPTLFIASFVASAGVVVAEDTFWWGFQPYESLESYDPIFEICGSNCSDCAPGARQCFAEDFANICYEPDLGESCCRDKYGSRFQVTWNYTSS